MATVPGAVRIGELSRRVGVSPELLRAWETRYRLLRPRRSPGGFRLYSPADEARVRRMRALVGSGLSASEAARAALGERITLMGSRSLPAGVVAALDRALLAFDGPAAHAALDALLAATPLERAVRDAILPLLRAIGDRWELGTVTVAQEHFAATLLRARILALARGWDEGRGRRAILACVPGDLHDIALIAFGLVLRERGWRIVYLGQDMPAAMVAAAAARLRPQLVVLSATATTWSDDTLDAFADLARTTRIAVGGAGATPEAARRIGATLLEADIIAAAERVASETPR